MKTGFTIAAFALVLAGPASGEESSSTGRPGQVLAPGFSSRVFVQAPQINAPSAIAAGPPGVIFLGEDLGNVRQTISGSGRVLRLVDGNRDGVVESTSVFAEKINGPRGLAFLDGALYVVHPPFLSVLRDADGDGVAEHREDLVTGLGFPPEQLAPDHSAGGVVPAIDGWLYIALGDQGMLRAQGKDGEGVTLRGGGVVRVRPDGSELEIYARGTRNNYDVAVTSALDLFVRDNTNDGGGWDTRFAHLPQTADLGYPRLFTNFADEALATLADYGGGSGAGALWIEEPRWPAPYRRVLLTADWGRGRVYSHGLTAAGATFSVSQKELLVGVRPLDLALDRDGVLYVVDWGPHSYGQPDPPSGLVYRVVPKGWRPLPAAPDFGRLSDRALVSALRTDRGVDRLAAQRALLGRYAAGPPPAAVLQALEDLARRPGDQAVRVAALYTMKQLGRGGALPALERLFQVPALREHALRAMTDRRGELSGVRRPLVEQALRDRDPRVRAQAAISLGRLGDGGAGAALVRATADRDGVVSHAGMQALRQIGTGEACVAALDDPDPAVVQGALRALRGMHSLDVAAALERALVAALSSERRAAVVELLARLYHQERAWTGRWWGIRPDRRGPHFDPAPWAATPAIHRLLVAQLETGDPLVRQATLTALGKYRISLPEAQRAMVKRLDEGGALAVAAAAALAETRPLDAEVEPALTKVVLSPAYPAATREHAFAALSHIQGGARAPALARLLATLDKQKDVPASLIAAGARVLLQVGGADAQKEVPRLAGTMSGANRGALFEAVLQVRGRQTREMVRALWGDARHHTQLVAAVGKTGARGQLAPMLALLPGAAPHLRVEALRVIGSLRDATAAPALLSLIEQDLNRAEALQALNAIGPARFPAARLEATTDALVRITQTVGSAGEARVMTDLIRTSRAFAEYPLSDPEKRARWLAALPQAPVIPPDQVLVCDLTYEQTVEALPRQRGDVERGRELFQQLACGTCHTLSPADPPRGPFLGDIAQRYGERQLLESVMRPNAVIAFGYQSHWFQLDDGATVEGFIASDKGDRYELRNGAGETAVVMKARIAKQGESAQSIMPDGLVDRLSVKDLSSLMAYLRTLKGAARSSTASGR